MGGKHGSIRKNYNSWRLSRKRGNSKLKKAAFCPICNLEFKSWQTYDDFNYHIDNCLVLSDPSQSLILSRHFSKLDSLEEKFCWVRDQFSTIRIPWSEEYEILNICRENVLEDSFRETQRLSDRDMRKELHIQFSGEMCMDAGGIMRNGLIF